MEDILVPDGSHGLDNFVDSFEGIQKGKSKNSTNKNKTTKSEISIVRV